MTHRIKGRRPLGIKGLRKPISGARAIECKRAAQPRPLPAVQVKNRCRIGATRISEFMKDTRIGATRISEFMKDTTNHSFLGLVSAHFSVMIESILAKSSERRGWRFALLSNQPSSGRSCASARWSLGKRLRFGKTVFAIRSAEQTRRLVAASRQEIRY